MEQTPGFSSTPENLPEQKKTIERPPSADYFSNDPEGKKLKKKLLRIMPNVDNEHNYLDGHQFKVRGYFETAQAKYLLGEPYEEDIDKALAVLKIYSNEFSRNLVKTNSFKDLFEFYKKFELPIDKRIENAISDIKNMPNTGGFFGTDERDKGELSLNASRMYLREGDFSKAAALQEGVAAIPYRAIFIAECALQVADIQQKNILYSKALTLLEEHKTDKENDYSFCEAVNGVAAALVKDGYSTEANKILKYLSSTSHKVSAAEMLVAAGKVSEKEKKGFLNDVVSHIGESKEYASNKKEYYGTIAAQYVNIGDIEHAKEILALSPESSAFQTRAFLDGLDPETIKFNESARDFIAEYFSDEKNFSQSDKSIFQRSAVKVLAEMGYFKQASGVLTKGAHADVIVSFTEGVNNNISIQPRDQEQNLPPLKFEKLFSTPRRAFWAGNFLGDEIHNKPDELPEHIQLAYDIGKNHSVDSTETEFDIGAKYTPQTIRAFLIGMKQYKFENIPEALEAIFDALPDEGDQVVYDFIASDPVAARRLVKVLIDIDRTKGTRYAQELAVRKVTPDRVFAHFAKVMIRHGRFSENLRPFLGTKENIAAVRNLLGSRPNQFNNVVDIVSGLGIINLADEEALEQGLEHLGTLTPGIYKKYRTLPLKERKEFVEAVEKFDYSQFFKNEPVFKKKKDAKFDKDVLLDLLYRAYNPVNMSYSQVREMLATVKDRTRDIETLEFPESYEVHFKKPNYVLRQGESLDLDTIRKLDDMFRPTQISQEKRNESFLKLIRATTEFTDKEASELFSVLQEKTQYQTARKIFYGSLDSTAFQDLSSLKEIFGVFAADNFGRAMEEVIKKEGLISNKVEALLANPERRKNILKALGNQEENEFTKDSTTIDLVSKLFSEKVLSKYNILINKELRKFKPSEEDAALDCEAKVFISKNQGSFFAKASAGLCTDKDIELWNMPNHFHFNTVNETNTVKGNTMGYIEKVAGERSLVLRGFNPTEQYLKEITAESFVEEHLQIARQFKKDNNLAHIYLVLGGAWDSNRQQVVRYLNSKYSALPEVQHKLKVSTNTEIDNIRLLE